MAMHVVEADTVLLEASQLAFWREFGFLAMNRITSPGDVAFIRSLAQQLITQQAGFAEGALFDALGAPEGEAPRFTQIINPHNYARALLRSDFLLNAQAIARQLLGPEAKFATDLLLIKPARTGGATPWHQDEAFRDPAYDRHDLSFWLPLHPVDQRNSCMEFLPGSHLGEVLEHRLLNGDPKVHALECCGAFDPARAVPCPLPVGGATLHTGRTLHYAGPNLSDAPRYAYVVIFDTPPTPHPKPRSFPWQAGWQTDRQEREASWRRRGGFAVEIWRGLRKVGVNPQRLSIYARRFVQRMRPAASKPTATAPAPRKEELPWQRPVSEPGRSLNGA
jgi:hypothetical protein